MLTHLPTGLLGLMLASLVAAYMSTVASQLNWGASYVVNDVWLRHVNAQASPKAQVRVGRVATVLLMLASGTLSLFLSDALQAFQILLQVGAGTGLIFLLRWFWWRINGEAELAAMISSFLVALAMLFWAPADWSDSFRLVLSVATTTVVWFTTALLTTPTSRDMLFDFIRKIDPPGPGWRKVRDEAKALGLELPKAPAHALARGIACVPAALAAIYATLFGMGALIFGHWMSALIWLVIAAAGGWFISRVWRGLFEMP